MAQTNLTIRIDEDVKHEAEALFNDMGLTLSAAVNVFFRQALRVRGVPFELKAQDVRGARPGSEAVLSHYGPLGQQFGITQADVDEVLARFFKADGTPRTRALPAQEKKKAILLHALMAHFDPAQPYTEQDVNAVISRWFDDFALARRYLVEYGLLTRDASGGTYSVARSTA